MTVQTRVQKGMAFLDEYGPDDWRNAIDLDSLDLREATSCVLGQLYGVYSFVEDDPDVAFNFYPFPYEDLGFEVEDETYAELTSAWKRALEA